MHHPVITSFSFFIKLSAKPHLALLAVKHDILLHGLEDACGRRHIALDGGQNGIHLLHHLHALADVVIDDVALHSQSCK
eukprot:1161047-Pelagomonas_calceolata.AAC.15